MGTKKEAMIEHRMTTERRNNPKRGLDQITGSFDYSKTLDRSTGANDALSRKHWAEEIRNSMYQMNNEELVVFIRNNPIEAERLRVCQQIANDEERQENET
jgi:hypothetical protein